MRSLLLPPNQKLQAYKRIQTRGIACDGGEPGMECDATRSSSRQVLSPVVAVTSKAILHSHPNRKHLVQGIDMAALPGRDTSPSPSPAVGLGEEIG